MRESGATRFYELMVITSPEGTPEELLATVDQINGYIAVAGGAILRSNSDSPWGRRRLAYPIRHESQDVRDGFYTLIHLEIAPDQVINVERDLKLNERLMRYLVLQLPGEPVFPEHEEEQEGETTEPQPAPDEVPASPDSVEASQADESTAESRREDSEAAATEVSDSASEVVSLEISEATSAPESEVVEDAVDTEATIAPDSDQESAEESDETGASEKE
jgi:small subunit ribosomal protein S6